MFIHLGGDVIVPKEEIVCIMNWSLISKAEATREFIQLAEDDKFIQRISHKGREKSFIVTSGKIYFSPISSVTLKKRASGWDNFLNE
jgi:hypothetical protein